MPQAKLEKLYMLDTNIISALIRDPHGPVAARIVNVGAETICVSIITAAELRYGGAKKGSAKLIVRIETILDAVDVLPFDLPADPEYGDIRMRLEAVGTPIGPNDLLIAAHARAIGATLVTHNAGEFERVDGLAVEDWLAA